MKYWIVAIACCCLQHYCLSQNQEEIDSLLDIIESDISTNEKVDTYVRLAEKYSKGDSSSTSGYVNEAVSLASKIGYTEGLIDAWYELAIVNVNDGNHVFADSLLNELIAISKKAGYVKGEGKAYFGLGRSNIYQDKAKAMSYYHEALGKFKVIDDQAEIARTYGNIGIIHKISENKEKAIEFYLKSLAILEEINDKKQLVSVYNNLAIIYAGLEEKEKALDGFMRSLELREELGDERGRITVLGNIGTLSKEMGNYDKALEYHLLALEGRKQLNMRSLPFSYFYVANLYEELDEYDSALKYSFLALEAYDEKNLASQKYSAYITLGEVFRKQGKPEKAKRYLNLAIPSATERKKIGALSSIAEQLALTERVLGNYKAAYDAHVWFKEMEDSLLVKENEKSARAIAAKYDIQRATDSIQFVNDREKLVLNRTIERQQYVKYSAIVGIVILVVIIFIIYRYYRLKKKAYALLEEKNIEIAKQAEELKEFNSRLEKMVEERTNKIQEQAKRLREYAFSNSHVVRAPLARIIGLTEVLNHTMKLTDDEWEELRGNIKDSADELDAAIKEIGEVISRDFMEG